LINSLLFFTGAAESPVDELTTLCSQENIFRCENDRNQCVPSSVKCDGVANCDNGRDEAVDICGCLPTEFQCNMTTCINIVQRCDTRVDCDNGSDEMHCETYVCPPTTHIKCKNHFCVSRDAQCNFKDDCGDNSDEKTCTRKSCTATEFKCNNSQCVFMAYLCDGIADCVDGSDEDQAQCDKHFKCPLGFYIADDHVCDGWSDCPFIQADEINCSAECKSNQFRCPNSQCIGAGNVCDGVCDCLSCADEDNCESQRCTVKEKYFCHSREHPTRCIDRDRVCDTQNDCRDSSKGQDELSCIDTTHNCSHFDMTYKKKFFKCPEGRCIPEQKRCDYYMDCQNGEDEKNCNFTSCSPGQFQCDTRQCVPMSARCDIKHDCKDWSDELNCENFQCPPNTKKCKSGQCVAAEFWCDYTRDCPDGSDERGCEPRTCKENEFTCNSGQCINFSMLCYHDRSQARQGCADNSHLFNCSNHTCPAGQMKCHFPCPLNSEVCVCRGDEMNCEKKQLVTIPPQIEMEHYSKLRFRSNKLRLTNHTFDDQCYDKVTYLDLSNNSLTEIPVHIFDTMWQLTYLHLGDNNLTILKNGTFHRLSMLRQL
ncbi:unnamed protein product, partial [Candidula unifasciata]